MNRKAQPIVLGRWGKDRKVEDEEFLLSLLRQGLLLRRRAAVACLEHASLHAANLELRLAMAGTICQQFGLQVEDTLAWCVAVPRWVSERPETKLADVYSARFASKDDPKKHIRVKDKLTEVVSDLGGMNPSQFLRSFGLPHNPQEYERLLGPDLFIRPRTAGSSPSERYRELKKHRSDLFKDLRNPRLVNVLQKMKHGPQLTVEPVPEGSPVAQEAEPRHCLRILGNGARIRATSGDKCPCIVGTTEAVEYMVKWIDRVARSLWLLTHWIYITSSGHAAPVTETEIHVTGRWVQEADSLAPF